jgi:hypothetical protein
MGINSWHFAGFLKTLTLADQGSEAAGLRADVVISAKFALLWPLCNQLRALLR